jgi:hypothetical protein
MVGRHTTRIVILTPAPGEPSASPLPDATAQNAQLDLYSKRLLDIASERGCHTLDLFLALGRDRAAFKAPLTDNGVHFSAYGYWRIAPVAMAALGLAADAAELRIVERAAPRQAAPERSGPGYAFTPARLTLPSPPPPIDAPPVAAEEAAKLVVAIAGLAPGAYRLTIDGVSVADGSADDWARGVALAHDPDAPQAETLRQAIVKKNELFFHRFRPANETYIFGFRQKEQGRNAVEMPQFDALVEEQEKRIVELSVPRSHRYELAPTAAR